VRCLQLLPAGSLLPSGGLLLAGQDPRLLKRQALRRRGRGVGLVFQDPMTRLNPLAAGGEPSLDTLAAHRPRWARQRVRQRALACVNPGGGFWGEKKKSPASASNSYPMNSAVACRSACRSALGPWPWNHPW